METIFVFAALLLGVGAGYALNRFAVHILERYTGKAWAYSGLIRKGPGTRRLLKADMAILEIAAALLTALLFHRTGAVAAFGFDILIIYIILLLCLIDIRLRVLPDILTYSGIVVGLLYVPFRENFGWLDALAGLATGVAFPLASAGIYYLWRGEEGLGMGDVKLLAFFGTFAGWQGVMVIMASGALAASGWGLLTALLQRRPQPLKEELPFGPFLGSAALVYIMSAV